MNISEIASANAYAVNNNNDQNSLQTAARSYKDKRPAGLTDEEIEEIEKQASLYLEQHPIRTDSDRDAFHSFLKSLLKKYGFKGDLDEYAGILAENAENFAKDEQMSNIYQSFAVNPAELYQRETLGAMSVKNKLFS